MGKPRTDAERQVIHKELYGTDAPKVRGQRFRTTRDKLERGIVE